MDQKTLEAAASNGIITADQVEALLRFQIEGNLAPIDKDLEEQQGQQRLIRSFGDVFITLGIVFVMFASALIDKNQYLNLVPIAIVIVAAEWLVRVRRLALPGVALLVSMLYFAMQIIGFSVFDFIDAGNGGLIKLAVLTGLAIIFYLRYKIPFTLVPISVGAIGCISLFLGLNILGNPYVFIGYGLSMFVAAMCFDCRDRLRQSMLSDSGFWLHFLAAPLIVHGLMVSFLTSAEIGQFREIGIVLFLVIFFLIALYVDRRAILVSSLSYGIYAASKLASSNIENATLLIFAAFGVFLIFSGVYWHKTRNALFSKTSQMWPSGFVPGFGER